MALQKVNVIGTGHVGLPLALLLAQNGVKVVGVDINRELVNAINNRALNLGEGDLQKLFDDPRVAANLIASEKPVEGDAFVISVPTPLSDPRKICDLSPVLQALDAIIPVLRKGNLINIESTIPPMTCRDIVAPVLRKAGFEPGKDIFLTHCPERILPGDVFYEIVHNDRIIGGFDTESGKLAEQIYKPFLKGQMFHTDITTAELCKLMENTYRDVNIALANELAITAQKLGVDIYEAVNLANRHPRVKFLYPGIGVGGHCLAVDPWFISEVDPEDSTVIMAARRVNDRMPEVVATRIRRLVANTPNPHLLILGATYKPETYDPRNSPALDVVELLRVEGYSLEVYDPNVKQFNAPKLAERLTAKKVTHIFTLVPHKAILQELKALGVKDDTVAGVPFFTVEDLVRGKSVANPARTHRG
ncbi:MAG TPA: nucleotide sugar dehydrogenase [Planctomycetota bacterium]|nr:nucleotide sugar dehydrogenase [Planctomycetota bacterium]